MNQKIADTPRLLATLSLALAIVLAGTAGTAVAQVTVLLPTDGDLKTTLALPGDVKRGKDAYGECQSCHRSDASGRPKFDIPRLSGQHASVLIKQLMDIRSGLRINPQMQDYMLDSGFTLQDFADIAAYLQSLPVVGPLQGSARTGAARPGAVCHQLRGVPWRARRGPPGAVLPDARVAALQLPVARA